MYNAGGLFYAAAAAAAGGGGGGGGTCLHTCSPCLEMCVVDLHIRCVFVLVPGAVVREPGRMLTMKWADTLSRLSMYITLECATDTGCWLGEVLGSDHVLRTGVLWRLNFAIRVVHRDDSSVLRDCVSRIALIRDGEAAYTTGLMHSILYLYTSFHW